MKHVATLILFLLAFLAYTVVMAQFGPGIFTRVVINGTATELEADGDAVIDGDLAMPDSSTLTLGPATGGVIQFPADSGSIYWDAFGLGGSIVNSPSQLTISTLSSKALWVKSLNNHLVLNSGTGSVILSSGAPGSTALKSDGTTVEIFNTLNLDGITSCADLETDGADNVICGTDDTLDLTAPYTWPGTAAYQLNINAIGELEFETGGQVRACLGGVATGQAGTCPGSADDLSAAGDCVLLNMDANGSGYGVAICAGAGVPSATGCDEIADRGNMYFNVLNDVQPWSVYYCQGTTGGSFAWSAIKENLTSGTSEPSTPCNPGSYYLREGNYTTTADEMQICLKDSGGTTTWKVAADAN